MAQTSSSRKGNQLQVLQMRKLNRALQCESCNPAWTIVPLTSNILELRCSIERNTEEQEEGG